MSRFTVRMYTQSLLVLGLLLGAWSSNQADAATLTVKNNCNYTVYPGLYPPTYQNGGWSQAPAFAGCCRAAHSDLTTRASGSMGPGDKHRDDSWRARGVPSHG